MYKSELFWCKNSNTFIQKLSDLNDICLIYEHWLKPHELCSTGNVCQKWCSLKSSVDPDVVQSGCPFGGVGFICKKQKHV